MKKIKAWVTRKRVIEFQALIDIEYEKDGDLEELERDTLPLEDKVPSDEWEEVSDGYEAIHIDCYEEETDDEQNT